METPPSPPDSDLQHAWETRLAQVPLVSPPPELRAICLKAGSWKPSPLAGATHWKTFWQTLWKEHRWTLQGLAAAWAFILGLQLATPEIPLPVATSRTVMTDETLRFLARQREDFLASIRDGDVSDLRGAEEPGPPVRLPAPDTSNPPRGTLSTNRTG